MDGDVRRWFLLGLGYGLGITLGYEMGAALGREVKMRQLARSDRQVFLPTTSATRVELSRDGIRFVEPAIPVAGDRVEHSTEDTEGVGEDGGRHSD